MGSSKMTYGNRQERQKGIALLISLTVILLLSIALMKNFEKRSVEVAHLGNNLERFQAESLSRSVFRVILTAIKVQGLINLLGNRSYWQDIDFSLGNGFFKIKEVTPIDHRFNLNWQIQDGNDHRIDVFENMVRTNIELLGGYNYLSEENSKEALSAIIDWTDGDSNMDEIFRYGPEEYHGEAPAFSVKNREFDRLSEVKLLPSFRSLGITADYLRSNFRVLGQYDEYIDVNLVNEKDFKDFLGRYKDVAEYPNLFEQQNQIWEIIENQRSVGSSENSSGPREISTPFPAKGFGKVWNGALVDNGINLSLEEKDSDLFRAYSENLVIRFQVQVGKATVNIRSTVQIKYRKDSLDIEKLGILSFRMI
jgi:type II secretory pathway component PulK